MNTEVLLLIKKHTDTLIEQTKTKPQETIAFTLNKRSDNFSFCPLINLTKEGKWLLAFTSFEVINSVFKITDENNILFYTTPNHWNPKGVEVTFDKLNKSLELTSRDDFKYLLKKLKKVV